MNKTYVIAEIGINHNGDLNLAKKLIFIHFKIRHYLFPSNNSPHKDV